MSCGTVIVASLLLDAIASWMRYRIGFKKRAIAKLLRFLCTPYAKTRRYGVALPCSGSMGLWHGTCYAKAMRVDSMAEVTTMHCLWHGN